MNSSDWRCRAVMTTLHFAFIFGDLHVVPFKGCLGGSCILLCAYEREMNCSVPKHCKKGLCKKALCSYWRGKISSPDNPTSCLQNTNVLGIALKCHARFWFFPEQCPESEWFSGECSPSRMRLFLRLYIWNCWSVAQISTSLFKHRDFMFRDAEPVPIAAPFQWWVALSRRQPYTPDLFLFYLQTLCTEKTLQHWKRSNPYTWYMG